MELQVAKETFINTWGALGSEWGINKSVAQVHAVLLSAYDPLSTDDIMEQLKISRGNANMSIRQLMDYGIVYKKIVSGDRKEYFVAEKDILKWALKIAMVRKQKEIDPIMGVMQDLSHSLKKEKTDEGKEFYNTIKEIQTFTQQIGAIADKVGQSNRSELLMKLLKLIL